MKIKAKKGIILIITAVLLLGVGLVVLSMSHNAKSIKHFVADGFILDAPAEVAATEVNKQYYFQQGEKYQEKYETKVLFKDVNGESVSLDVNQYLHYADGSLGSFTKGVIVNLDDVEEKQFGYYSLSPNTLLVKNGSNYEMSSRGEQMAISEFVWKISDTDYMMVSPEITLKLSNDQEVTMPDYAQIKYVDSGIVRIVHQQGTYQTVSAESSLFSESGTELNLVGKSFWQDGEAGVSLDAMSLNNDDYIELDENMDEPEIKIPTFNVINGKDGAAGTAGLAGEDGEEGEDGEQGEVGTNGAAGNEGLQGSKGDQGKNGVEGDAGVLGYDGAEGDDGEDATNSDNPIQAADLLIRPTISVDAGGSSNSDGGTGTMEGYKVSQSSVEMLLQLNDSDNALVMNQNKTLVEIYDRATMQKVTTDRSAAELGAMLESTGSLSFKQGKLDLDTEYMLVVKGQYAVGEGVPEKEGTLFTKVFKTDALGVVLSKNTVTENSVSVTSTVTASNILSYDVHYYTYAADGTKQSIGYAKGLNGVGSQVLKFDNGEPTDRAAGYENYTPQPNTAYYAEVANVITEQGMVNVGETAVELKTLKTKPYHKEGDVITSVTAMVPDVTVSERNRTITLGVGSISDDHNGIKCYKYELYSEIEFNDAATNGTLDELVPAYSKRVEKLSDQTFSLPEGINGAYRGRIVVEFNDNEKDVEYATLFTEPKTLYATTSNLTVTFDNTTAYHDKISGSFVVRDVDDVALSKITNTNPMVLTIFGEHDDVMTINFGADAVQIVNNECVFNFEQTGLHKNSVYSLSVSGPWDIDRDGALADAEKNVYYSGCRMKTAETATMSMAFRSIAGPASAFATRCYLSTPVGVGTDTNLPSADFYQHQAKVMEEIEFKLIHISDLGEEKQLGQSAFIKDMQVANLTQDSVFFDSCWVDRTNLTTNAQTGIGLVAPDNANVAKEHDYILTPASFGLDDNDSRFFAGGMFKIKAVVAKDYTTHENEISFIEGEDVAVFSIAKRHVMATDPNHQVRTEIITNSGAKASYKEADKADDTVVGIRFQAEYPYTDVKNITYYIYELKEGEGGAGATADYATTLLYDGTIPCELVLTGTQTVGSSGRYTAPEVELYFKGTKCESGADGGLSFVWYKGDGTTEATGSDILQRGKRYFIRYEVTADATNIDCNSDGNDDKYPTCAYVAGVDVPYYRSAIVEFNRQVPSVQRYPLTSDGDSATWMYRVIDPDNAIIGGFKVKKAASAAEVLASTTYASEIPATIAEYASYKEVEIAGLTVGEFYAVDMEYMLSSSSPKMVISSIPVYFAGQTAGAPAGISCKGVGSAQAIVNEGGYRYKVTVQGADIAKYAAFEVIFTANDGSVPGKQLV